MELEGGTLHFRGGRFLSLGGILTYYQGFLMMI